MLVPTSFLEVPQKGDDPLADLLSEFDDYDLPEEVELPLPRPAPAVLKQREDQMMFTLNNQLGALRESLTRTKFYLSDVENSLKR